MHLRNHKNFKKMKHKKFALGVFVSGGFVRGLCPGGVLSRGFLSWNCSLTAKFFINKTEASLNPKKDAMCHLEELDPVPTFTFELFSSKTKALH